MILPTFDISAFMKILLLEPFFGGSHKTWAIGLQQNTKHEINILSLKGRHWKWRMYGGAISLAKQFLTSDFKPDLILATDMLDLATFLGLTQSKSFGIPKAVYFHENQITYPWSPKDEDIVLKRNNQYGFLNYTSALAADALFFNSRYHKNSFLGALPEFLKQFPDNRELQNVDLIQKKSNVLNLGMDLSKFDSFKETVNNSVPVLLWNHRWEYDKNPELFFKTLFRLKEEYLDFQVVILGESYKKSPLIFDEAKSKLGDRILKYGYAESFEVYASWLWKSDIYPVTSNQDFFGGSVVEAIYCNCFPVLPKRLAYPEHIPEKYHDEHFYDSDNTFYQMLKKCLITFGDRNTKKSESIIDNSKGLSSEFRRDFVAQYDWSTLAPRYDEAFERITNIHATN